MIHKAKKSLGQNFLKSELALKKIIEAGEIKPGDVVLEIGPGKGALTEKLLQTGATVVAVEKDRELFEFLKTKFATQIQLGAFVLINEDILNFNLKQNVLERTSSQRDGARKAIHQQVNMRGESENILCSYKLIANIPYNITGAILKKFLTAENQPERMVLMVQHEVASRIVARDGKESILSISVKAYGEPKMVMKVNKRYFSPEPKVDSAIIEIKNISRQFFYKNKINEEKFWEIVKNGFAHKRKKLSSNLKGLISTEKLSSANLGDKRAEDLSLSDWSMLAKN
ncbi:MAG: 16S rRNA (adenine(1518)-N(6)/adenine(1519)-N(6))-dimethyltransferase RsmA [Minisyncoccia bacterium]